MLEAGVEQAIRHGDRYLLAVAVIAFALLLAAWRLRATAAAALALAALAGAFVVLATPGYVEARGQCAAILDVYVPGVVAVTFEDGGLVGSRGDGDPYWADRCAALLHRPS